MLAYTGLGLAFFLRGLSESELCERGSRVLTGGKDHKLLGVNHVQPSYYLEKNLWKICILENCGEARHWNEE